MERTCTPWVDIPSATKILQTNFPYGRLMALLIDSNFCLAAFSKTDRILPIIKLPKLILNSWHMADNNTRSSAEMESNDPFLSTRLVVMKQWSIQCLTLRAFSTRGSKFTSIKRNSRSCPSTELLRTWFMKVAERDTDYPLTDEHNPSWQKLMLQQKYQTSSGKTSCSNNAKLLILNLDSSSVNLSLVVERQDKLNLHLKIISLPWK